MHLLPHPDRPYSALKGDLLRLGWQWANEVQALPLLPGEPEWVEYRHPSGGRLRYEFNPAIGLRTMEVEAPSEQLAALGSLPRLGPGDVEALLEGPSVEEILRGLFAARALRLMPLLPRVQALREHPDDLVQRTATDVAGTLPVAAVREGWEQFQALRAKHPDRSAFLAMLPVEDRRQVLRWLGRERKAPGEPVLAALRTGLADEDAEVRVTAALVAARLGLVALAAEVERLALPAEFGRAHAVAYEALAGDALAARPRTRLDLPEPANDDDLLLHALLEPLPVVPAPTALPRHLRTKHQRVCLARSTIELALVPSLPHWLGGGALGPLRATRARAFAISVTPIDSRALRAVGCAVKGDDTLRLTLAEARDVARQLGVVEGVAIGLPSAEEWEMALRGPDGRRYASGNLGAEPALSPWGVAALPGIEWLADGSARDPLARFGSIAPAPDERCAFRIALAFPI
jgi:hypothetical protein